MAIECSQLFHFVRICFPKKSELLNIMSIFGINLENAYKQAYVWSSGSWDSLWYFHKEDISFLLIPVVSTKSIKTKTIHIPSCVVDTFTFFQKICKNVRIVKKCAHIWNQLGNWSKMSTNKPMFGPMILETASYIFITKTYVSIVTCT